MRRLASVFASPTSPPPASAKVAQVVSNDTVLLAILFCRAPVCASVAFTAHPAAAVAAACCARHRVHAVCSKLLQHLNHEIHV